MNQEMQNRISKEFLKDGQKEADKFMMELFWKALIMAAEDLWDSECNLDEKFGGDSKLWLINIYEKKEDYIEATIANWIAEAYDE